jgi:hypothetical protein
MGIPLDHIEGLVPQHLSDLQETGAVHGEVGRCGVPQVVKMETLDPRSPYRTLPCGSDIGWSGSRGVREHQ